METTRFSRDFILMVIGQIISLFGNAAVRFALPLYLLNQTGSSALYGMVTALAFLPMVLFSPVGGIIADRVNKRNVMVLLDFFTAAVLLGFSLLRGRLALTPLLTAAMMLLYGIAGAYQPSVQASIPLLAPPEKLLQANAVVNTVSSFSSLLGPVLGGVLYSAYGLTPVLRVSMACFFLSAVMELFLRIPFAPAPAPAGVWSMVRSDLAASFRFLLREKPAIGRGVAAVCGLNFCLSSMLVVGVPYLVTEVLPLTAAAASRLCGFAEGALAAGGLAGGVAAGVLGRRLSIRHAGSLLAAAAVCVLPMSAAMLRPAAWSWLVLAVCCFAVMICATVFTVLMLSFVQAETPPALLGRVTSAILTVSLCAQPLGNVFYGAAFELSARQAWLPVLFSAAASFLIALRTRRLFAALPAA